MNPVTKLHHEAMAVADEATIAQVKGKAAVAKQKFAEAFMIEKMAVELMPLNGADPVPRPVLMRGAAALAYKAGLYNDAENIIAKCLAGNPPLYVINELDEITALTKVAREGSHLIKGKLTSANESAITIQEMDSSKFYSIDVPSEKLKKGVKKFFMETVSVQAITNYKGGIFLEKISKAA